MVLFLAALGSGCGYMPVPYSINYFWFDSDENQPPHKPPVYQKDQSIPISFLVAKHNVPFSVFDKPPYNNHPYPFPFTMFVRDPDGLLHRWTQPDSIRRRNYDVMWHETKTGIRESTNLRDWAPKNFTWRPGWYTVSLAVAEPASAHPPFPSRDPSRYSDWLHARPLPFGIQVPAAPMRVPTGKESSHLRVTLEVNKKTFKIGDKIIFKGYIDNTGKNFFLLQTLWPWRNARLVTAKWNGGSSFPSQYLLKHPAPLRRAHFVRLDPGKKYLYFTETFIAGERAPHMDRGTMWEMKLSWFTPGEYEIAMQMHGTSEFPLDRPAEVGIWSGQARSNGVTVRVLEAKATVILTRARDR